MLLPSLIFPLSSSFGHSDSARNNEHPMCEYFKVWRREVEGVARSVQIEAVCEHVRKWRFSPKKKVAKKAK